MPLSINEAVRAGVNRLRLDKWSNKHDHIKLTIVVNAENGERMLGPWWELWSPLNEANNGRNPVKNLIVGPRGLGDLDDPCWTIYAPIESPQAEGLVKCRPHNVHTPNPT